METGPSRQNRIPATIIVQAWLLAGTLDILAAFIDYWLASGKGPQGVLLYVASGFFGPAAFGGGAGMAACGLLFHYLIAFCWTLFFFWIYTKIPCLPRYPLLTGLGFGLLIWMVMNLLVLPLSRIQQVPLSAVKPLKMGKSFLILACMIGLPLSFIAGSTAGTAKK